MPYFDVLPWEPVEPIEVPPHHLVLLSPLLVDVESRVSIPQCHLEIVREITDQHGHVVAKREANQYRVCWQPKQPVETVDRCERLTGTQRPGVTILVGGCHTLVALPTALVFPPTLTVNPDKPTLDGQSSPMLLPTWPTF